MGLAAIDSREAPKYLDISQIDARKSLEAYQVKQAMYSTAAFDPKGKQMRFFPGGFSIWSGFPGSGKTTLIRQTVCQMLKNGEYVFLASLEEGGEDILIRLAATAAGVPEPQEHEYRWFLDAYSQNLVVWTGRPQRGPLMAAIHELQFGHAFIDSLMCLDVANDDFEGQRQVANLFAVTARTTNCHIHLVAHPRKLISTKQELDLNDVAGAREIGGLADNVIFIKRRDDAVQYQSGSACTPMAVSIRKQRHFDGGLGEITGWYHRGIRQFHVEQFTHRARYLPDVAYAEDGSILP